MKSLRLLVVSLAISASGSAFAQQDLVGKWNGSFTTMGARKSLSFPMVLEITSAENGKVSGKYQQLGGDCRGNYDVEGTYNGTALKLRVGAGERQGCGGGGMNLSMDGGKLVGKYGEKNEVTLTK